MASLFFDRNFMFPPTHQMEGPGGYVAGFWEPLPLEVDEFITSTPEAVKSWKPNCPVPKSDLVYVQIHLWHSRGEHGTGEMVVHKDVARDIGEIFRQLFESRFVVERMELIDRYSANDDLSMEANNTSAFCSRDITDKPGIFSVHSYGRAVDINPLHNPYIRKREDGTLAIYPKNTPPQYIKNPEITGDSVCVRAFKARGWEWGGEWANSKGYQDYQHFQKDVL